MSNKIIGFIESLRKKYLVPLSNLKHENPKKFKEIL